MNKASKPSKKTKPLSLREYFKGEGFTKKNIFWILFLVSVYFLALAAFELNYSFFIIDKIFTDGRTDLFAVFFTILMVMQLVEAGSYYVWWQTIHKHEFRNEFKRTRKTLSAFLNSKTKSAIEIPTGKLVNTIVYNTYDGGFVLYEASLYFGRLIFSIICVIFLFIISWKLTLIMIACYAVALILFILVSKINYKANLKQVNYYNDYYQIISESIEGLEYIKANNKQEVINSSFNNSNKTLGGFQLKKAFAGRITNTVSFLIANLLTAVVYLIGGLEQIAGGITVGQLFAFIYLALTTIARISDMNLAVTEIRTRMAAATRYKELQSIEQEDIMAGYTGENINIKKAIEMKNVTHAYGNRTYLNKFNLKIKAGETIFLTRNDAPAATNVCNILTGFYDFEEGEVLFDGESIKNKSLFDLRNSISYCLKDSEILSGTIMENITMFNKDLEARAYAVSKAIGLEKVVLTYEKWYDTFIKQSTVTLSESEKQLICVARALVLDRNILLINNSLNKLTTPQAERIVNYIRRTRGQGTNKINLIAIDKHSIIKPDEHVVYIKNGRVQHNTTCAKLKDKGLGF